MLDLTAVLTFAAAAGLLTVTPGLDTALVLRTAAVEGGGEARFAACGICAGCLIWGTATSLSLTGLLAVSELAYNAVRIAGACYLVYLGIRMWARKREFNIEADPLSDAAARPRNGNGGHRWLVRGAGVHASAVVIAPRPLTELVPLAKTKNDEIVTAYDMKAVEKMGLLKMDFLGLTTLTVIDDCLKLIEAGREEKLDTETIPLNDEETYKRVFHAALTSGVFQFESSGMRDVLRRYKPDRMEDLTALNALYRPGPMSMIDDFIDRKCGRRKVEYMLPEIEEILKETLGVIVYQEQVMQIANVVASYSLGEADLLRRAMGKKDADEMAKQRDRFMSGAAALGHPKYTAGGIFRHTEKFAGYGFNKSHSA